MKLEMVKHAICGTEVELRQKQLARDDDGPGSATIWCPHCKAIVGPHVLTQPAGTLVGLSE